MYSTRPNVSSYNRWDFYFLSLFFCLLHPGGWGAITHLVEGWSVDASQRCELFIPIDICLCVWIMCECTHHHTLITLLFLSLIHPNRELSGSPRTSWQMVMLWAITLLYERLTGRETASTEKCVCAGKGWGVGEDAGSEGRKLIFKKQMHFLLDPTSITTYAVQCEDKVWR